MKSAGPAYVRSTLGVILGLSSGSLGAVLFFLAAFLARSAFFHKYVPATCSLSSASAFDSLVITFSARLSARGR